MEQAKAELQNKLDKLNEKLNFRWTKRLKSPTAPKPKVHVAEFDWAMDGKGKTYRDLEEMYENLDPLRHTLATNNDVPEPTTWSDRT